LKPPLSCCNSFSGRACNAKAEAVRKLCYTAPTTLAGLAGVLSAVIAAENDGDDILFFFADDEREDGGGERETCMWPFLRSVLRSVEQMQSAA
jgi:hypothetical protein